MSYGIITNGANSTLAISSYAATMVFRGKATQIGSVFYPADQPGSGLIITINNNQRSYYQETITESAGVLKGYERFYAFNGSLSRYTNIFTLTVSRTIAIATYRIICYNTPTVYTNTNNPATKAGILSIVQNGTSGGVPVWDIKVSIGFVQGTPQSTFLSNITLYCFSATHSSDNNSGYGLNVFLNSGAIAFSSNTKPLQLSDYIQVTSSTTPANIENMIYTRNFSPNPITPTLNLAKPGFMNNDFARYDTRKFITYSELSGGWTTGQTRNFNHWWWLDTKILNAGMSKTNAPELDFNLNIISASLVAQVYATSNWPNPPPPRQAPPYNDAILSKMEAFPVTIPVVDCTVYD